MGRGQPGSGGGGKGPLQKGKEIGILSYPVQSARSGSLDPKDLCSDLSPTR